MKVWVVASDVGLNGAVIHGIFTEPPVKFDAEQYVLEAHQGWGGYSNTYVLEVDLDARGPWNIDEGRSLR